MAKCCEFCGRGIEGFKRNTRKYCDDNCKQLAYYARQGLSWGKQVISGGATMLSLNVKPELTLSDKNYPEIENEMPVEQNAIAQQLEKQADNVKSVDTKQNVASDPSYRKVDSTLLIAIERHRERIEQYFHFSEHSKKSDIFTNMKWVTVRVRCLLENILHLDRLGYIDRHTIEVLTSALNDLTESVYFRYLPANYPFIESLRSLKLKFQGMLQRVKPGRIVFRLSPERKAQFMAYRFVIAGFVPKCKFSELDFSDGLKTEFQEDYEAKARNTEQDD